MHDLQTIIKQNETKTITVTIGRNIGSSPMDSQKWCNFQQSILEMGEDLGNVYFAGSSDSGKWRMKTEDEGTTEDSFNVVFSLVVGEIPRLKRQLTTLKQTYKQESIALTIGDFIGSSLYRKRVVTSDTAVLL